MAENQSSSNTFVSSRMEASGRTQRQSQRSQSEPRF
uniref:Uncharacterized protein n=1 Tax=Arundo donax TaxID=35708 RepID=A0A0A9AYN8_ARUDO